MAALEIQRARRRFGPAMPERPADSRADFELVTGTLGDAEAREEARRCLQCDLLCNICVTVCPNRANIAYTAVTGRYPVFEAAAIPEGVRLKPVDALEITQAPQIFNLGDACNHCGNCTRFCPTSGAPYLDKPRFYLSEAGFKADPNAYRLAEGALHARLEGEGASLYPEAGGLIYADDRVKASLDPDTLEVKAVDFKGASDGPVVLRQAVQVGVLWRSLKNFYLFRE
jgi:putative selenate reductase